MNTRPDFREQYVKGMATAEMHAATIGMVIDVLFIIVGVVLLAFASFFMFKIMGALIAGFWGWNLFRTIRAKLRPESEQPDAHSDAERPV